MCQTEKWRQISQNRENIRPFTAVRNTKRGFLHRKMPPFGLQKTVFCINIHRKRRQQRRSSVGTKTASVTDKYRPKNVKTPYPIAHISTNWRKPKNISKLRLHTIFAIFYTRHMFFTGDGRQNVKAKHNMSAQNAFYLLNANRNEYTCPAKNKHKNILYSDIFYTFAQDK